MKHNYYYYYPDKGLILLLLDIEPTSITSYTTLPNGIRIKNVTFYRFYEDIIDHRNYKLPGHVVDWLYTEEVTLEQPVEISGLDGSNDVGFISIPEYYDKDNPAGFPQQNPFLDSSFYIDPDEDDYDDYETD